MDAPDRHLAFISYSHTEDKWRQWVVDMLAPYVREGHLRVWADHYIPVGGMWRREIDAALRQTRVAVLLVSSEFERSPFINETEMPAVMTAADAGEATIVAVPISASSASEWKSLGLLGRLVERQWARPADEPLDLLPPAKRKRELVRIARVIADAFGPVAAVAAAGAARVPEPTRPLTPGGAGLLHNVPSLPAGLIPRPVFFDAVKASLLSRAVVGLTGRATSVGVQGLAGVGKTVLAQTIAHDDEIRHSFPDGVHWVTMGQHADLLSQQLALLRSLDPTATAVTLVECRAKLQDHCRNRQMLIVLDDVWDAGQALAFEVLPEQCRLLITTRELAVITAVGAAEHALDVFDGDESRAFLAERTGTTTLPPEAEQVADACGNLPLALAVVAGAVAEGRSWADIQRKLQDTSGPYSEHPFKPVFQALQASVDWLAPEDAARYFELAVFPNDERVPEATIQRYWAHTARLEAAGASALLERLDGKNLVKLSGPAGAREVSFHDLQLQFLRIQAEQPEILHGALLDAHRPQPDAAAREGWSVLPATEHYLWRNLAFHLQHAGAAEELRSLLLNAEWIEAKLTATGIVSLLADYAAFSADSVVSAIADTLRLAAHALIVNPRELRSQLWGRVDPQPSPELSDLLARCLMPSGFPWLRPMAVSLTSRHEPLLSILKGHTHWVTTVAVFSDGTRAVSGSADGVLVVWDLVSGRALFRFEEHSNAISAVVLAPDGLRVVSASFDGTLRVWDLARGRALHTLQGHAKSVRCVVVSGDGRRAVSGSNDGTLRLWDLTSGRAVRILQGHTDFVFTVAVTPDVTRAVSGSVDRTVRVWDLANGRTLHTLEGHTQFVTAVAVVPDGTRAVSSSGDGTLRVWDIADGHALHVLRGHTNAVNVVVVTPDGTRAVSGSLDGTLRVWDLTSGRALHTLEGHTGWVKAVAVTSDGARVVSGGHDRIVRVWDLTNGRALEALDGHGDVVNAVAVISAPPRAVSASQDRTLRVWNLASGSTLNLRERHTGSVKAIAATADGTCAVSGGDDGTLRVWDLASGRAMKVLKGHAPINSVSLTPDGTRAVSGSVSGTVEVWDLTSGRALHKLDQHLKPMFVGVTPDGRRAVSGSGYGRLRVWDLATGRALVEIEGDIGLLTALCVMPGGTQVLTASGSGVIRTWDLASGRLTEILEASAWVTAVALTPDGKWGISGDRKNVWLWDAIGGSVLHSLEGHTDEVTSVAVTPGGTRAVSCSKDGTLSVWDLASRLSLASFTADASMVCCAAAGDRCFVAGSADGRVHILKLEGEN